MLTKEPMIDHDIHSFSREGLGTRNKHAKRARNSTQNKIINKLITFMGSKGSLAWIGLLTWHSHVKDQSLRPRGYQQSLTHKAKPPSGLIANIANVCKVMCLQMIDQFVHKQATAVFSSEMLIIYRHLLPRPTLLHWTQLLLRNLVPSIKVPTVHLTPAFQHMVSVLSCIPLPPLVRIQDLSCIGTLVTWVLSTSTVDDDAILRYQKAGVITSEQRRIQFRLGH